MITVDLKTRRTLEADISERINRPLVTEIVTERRIIRSTPTWRLTEGWIALGMAATVFCIPLLATTGPASAQTRADGAQLVYATSGTISAQNPAFSPDGTTLIFTLYLKGYDGGANQPDCNVKKKINCDVGGIWQMPTANPGGTASEMTADHKYPNGSALLSATNVNGLASWNGPTNLVTFADINRDGNIWTMTPPGTVLVLKQITHAPSDMNHSYQEPTFAPDGKTIVFEDDFANSSDGDKSALSDEDDYVGSIATVSASGGAVRQLVTTGDNRLPVWSPDGTRILFQRRTVTTGAYHLFTISPNGGEPTQITDVGLDVDNLDSDASWSPDGKWILDSACYTTTPGAPCDGAESNIFLISADHLPGKPPTIIRVTNNRTEDGAPALSPDGHWIYFESHKGNDESISQIWRIATPKLP